jgi:hypothetical protein
MTCAALGSVMSGIAQPSSHEQALTKRHFLVAAASNAYRSTPGVRRVKGSGGSKTMAKTVGGRRIALSDSYGRR